MTSKEIDKLIEEKKEIKVIYFWSGESYYIGNVKITEKQFKAAKLRFLDRLSSQTKYEGITTTIYTLK